ncbi:MAG: class I SAM-dependent rRNA methyltransferase, partial [Actinobacteria bacterium]|nr:class I SAM-dependent rRNA methyltransferase [Actinomycetota bacterium]NIS35416.1 class I SAM-dependent rRNA methyltransferase [Actinomycetota bacterium]NIT95635.1 class I SAM-dependent rRNA methyltransferase [Actinomycetota bacterium]NIU19328.1 class I SAM-dependent rRNA methyltransferase [Actinomycetota bacterium]NIU66486.1 class I SAM-dependent rRNA methyltransferase [Actinomycetota bacterium]
MRVTADALRQIRGGHPWLFDSSITSVSHDGAPGDLAVVFDGRRRFAAIGLWDPGSPVRMRILHAGEPTPVDDDFWTARLAAAIERRRALEESSATTAYRLVHGENDGLPGLVVDRYDRVTVMKIYSPAWFAHLAAIVPLVEAATGAASVVLRLGRNVARGPTHGCADGMVVAGELDEPVG